MLKAIAACKDVVDSFSVERKYAYHWMDEKGKLYIRWDNSPHWSEVSTYPHHKHIGSPENIESSLEIDLRDVLKIIRSKIIVQKR